MAGSEPVDFPLTERRGAYEFATRALRRDWRWRAVHTSALFACLASSVRSADARSHCCDRAIYPVGDFEAIPANALRQCAVQRHQPPSGCESRPANCRSSRKQSERMMEVTTSFEALRQKGRLGRLSDHAGRNASERRAGLETSNAEADPPVSRGRLPAGGKRTTNAPVGSAGVVAGARMEEGDGSNTGSPVGGVHAPTGIP